MRNLLKLVIVGLILVPGLCLGQRGLLHELEGTTQQEISSRSLDRFDRYLQKLSLLQEEKSERALLKKVFKKTHRKYLKAYSAYVDFPDLFANGKYDCLTGTALYAVILNELNYNFDIIETNYHVFILVHLTRGNVLLETTDLISGYIDDPKGIERRMGSYHNSLRPSSESNRQYQYAFNLQQQVRPEQLPGLLYFNQAVNAFNRHDLLTCANLLDKSRALYESPRVAELATMLVQSVVQSKMESSAKNTVLQRYKKYLTAKASPLASR